MIHFDDARLVRTSSAAMVALALAFWPTEARASDGKLALAGDLDLAWARADEDTQKGWGMGFRLGWESSPLYILYFRPELGGHYYSFNGDAAPTILRGTGGVRLGFDLLLRFGVYAHAGVGKVDSPVADVSRTAFTYDFGAELDFPLIPVLDLGIHAAYESVNPNDAAKRDEITVVGLHAGLRF